MQLFLKATFWKKIMFFLKKITFYCLLANIMITRTVTVMSEIPPHCPVSERKCTLVWKCVCLSYHFSGNITVTVYTSYIFHNMPSTKNKTSTKVWYLMSRQSSMQGSYIPSFFMIGQFKLKLLTQKLFFLFLAIVALI